MRLGILLLFVLVFGLVTEAKYSKKCKKQAKETNSTEEKKKDDAAGEKDSGKTAEKLPAQPKSPKVKKRGGRRRGRWGGRRRGGRFRGRCRPSKKRGVCRGGSCGRGYNQGPKKAKPKQ
eukprot:TRINITY_DN6089_c0_g1_i12.p1 TRINITY_DN6089_c0_g1~~TRINITY_DN6089_c0_g1_i12.p1  ORF type:complete len:119 (+),score=20.68 TRINITY_DN6089_c0_g1_i12:222-578(+)